MADPLTILGAAASALTLGDAVGASAKRLYGFLWAIKRTKKDVSDLRDVLKDMYEIVTYVQSYAASLQALEQASGEQENLSDIIASLTGCQQELDFLQSLVDKATLIATHSDTLQNVKSDNELEMAMLRRYAYEVSQHAQQELESFRKLQNSVEQNSEEQKNILAEIRNSQAGDSKVLESIALRSTDHLQSTTNFQINVLRKIRGLETQFAAFSMEKRSMKAESRMNNVDDDTFRRILRGQVQSLLPDLVEECVSRARKEFRGYVRDSMDKIPEAVDQVLSEAMVQFASDDNMSRNFDAEEHCARQTEWPVAFEDTSRGLSGLHHQNYTRVDFTKDSRVSTARRWTFRWKIGTVILSIRKSTIRSGLGRTRTFDAAFEFIPALWIASTGLIVSYFHELDPRGYPLLCPKLSTFAVVSSNSEQFQLVRQGDIAKLRQLFIDGLASPQDRLGNGSSLLHHAIQFGQWGTSMFLISQGADVQTDNGHGNAMSTFYHFCLNDIGNQSWVDGDAIKIDGDSRYKLYRMIKERGADDTEYEEIKEPWVSRWMPMSGQSSSIIGKFMESILLLIRTRRSPSHSINRYCANTKSGVLLIATYRSIGMNFDSTDSDGWTCLNALAFNASHSTFPVHRFLLQSLLVAGYNANSRNTSGENAFHSILYGSIRGLSKATWCRSMNDLKKDVCNIVKLLYKYDCDLLARDSHGRTPTQLAIKLTEMLSIDIFSIWEEALRRLGIDVEHLISHENSLSQVGGTTGVETGRSQRVGDGFRRRKRRFEDNRVNERDRVDTDESICGCLACCFYHTDRIGYRLPERDSVLISGRIPHLRPAIYDWVLANRNVNHS